MFNDAASNNDRFLIEQEWVNLLSLFLVLGFLYARGLYSDKKSLDFLFCFMETIL